MPISKHYSGHGTKVMGRMKKQYGSKKGEQVFHATSHKRKQGPRNNPWSKLSPHRSSH